MANQTEIPVIQHPDKTVVQLQQNTNKVFRNLNNQVTSLNILGEVKFSAITLSQWQQVAGNEWIIANGQGCDGTKYAAAFGLNTVPNVSVSGVNAFIKVN